MTVDAQNVHLNENSEKGKELKRKKSDKDLTGEAHAMLVWI